MLIRFRRCCDFCSPVRVGGLSPTGTNLSVRSLSITALPARRRERLQRREGRGSRAPSQLRSGQAVPTAQALRKGQREGDGERETEMS